MLSLGKEFIQISILPGPLHRALGIESAQLILFDRKNEGINQLIGDFPNLKFTFKKEEHSDVDVRFWSQLIPEGRLHNISVPQFPFLENQHYNNTYLKCCHNTLAFEKT